MVSGCEHVHEGTLGVTAARMQWHGGGRAQYSPLRPPRVCEVLDVVGAVRAGHPGACWQVRDRLLLVVAPHADRVATCLCGCEPETLVVLNGRDGGTAVPACARCAERVVEAAVRELHTRGRCAHRVPARPG